MRSVITSTRQKPLRHSRKYNCCRHCHLSGAWSTSETWFVVLTVADIRREQVRDKETGTWKANWTSKKLKRYLNEIQGRVTFCR